MLWHGARTCLRTTWRILSRVHLEIEVALTSQELPFCEASLGWSGFRLSKNMVNAIHHGSLSFTVYPPEIELYTVNWHGASKWFK